MPTASMYQTQKPRPSQKKKKKINQIQNRNKSNKTNQTNQGLRYIPLKAETNLPRRQPFYIMRQRIPRPAIQDHKWLTHSKRTMMWNSQIPSACRWGKMKQRKQKTDKKDGEHAVSCIRPTKAQSWHYQPTKYLLQSTPNVKQDQAVSSYVCNAKKPWMQTLISAAMRNQHQ
jgi:hypothetical protein